MRYRLEGTFVEACTCTVICPCWVDDTPDEEHCAGLFAWTFDEGSVIEGHSVAGQSVVSASVHGLSGRRGGGTQSALYVSDTVGADVASLLVRAFSGRPGDGHEPDPGPLGRLAGVTGDVVAQGQAEVVVERNGKGWTLQVSLGDASLIHARTAPARFDSRPDPLTLSDTALSTELGMAAHEPVTAHHAEVLTVDVAPLPTGPVLVQGRSAMSGRFRYIRTGDDDD